MYKITTVRSCLVRAVCPFLVDEYGHIGQAGLAFLSSLSGLADRTARRRYEARKLTVPPGVMARQLYVPCGGGEADVYDHRAARSTQWRGSSRCWRVERSRASAMTGQPLLPCIDKTAQGV